MAVKKLYNINGTVETDPSLLDDYNSAAVFDRVHVGNAGVYYRDGLRTKFIPYSFPERAFIRVQEVNVRTCCANNSMFYFKLMFIKDGKEYGNIMSENESAMDRALAAISEKAPQIAIGYQKN